MENAFYLFVEAWDSDEAELLAEDYCRKGEENCFVEFWDSEASYKHATFEAEEAE